MTDWRPTPASDRERGERVDRPTVAGSVAAIAAAAIAVVLAGIPLPLSVPVGTVGVILLLAGLLRSTRRLIDIGALLVFGAVLASAVFGAPITSTGIATVCVIIAWDVGNRAVGLGQQIGRDAETIRIELVHLSVSLLIGLGSMLAGLLVFAVGAAGQPVAAVILLVLAAVFLLIGLGTRSTLLGATEPGGE